MIFCYNAYTIAKYTKMKKSKFAFLTGLVVGTLTAFFLSPRSGKENRERAQKKYKELEKLLQEKGVDKKVSEIFGTATEKTTELYNKVRQEALRNLTSLKGTVQDITKEDFFVAVEKSILKFKNVLKNEKAKTVTLRSSLKKEWDKLVDKK